MDAFDYAYEELVIILQLFVVANEAIDLADQFIELSQSWTFFFALVSELLILSFELFDNSHQLLKIFC